MNRPHKLYDIVDKNDRVVDRGTKADAFRKKLFTRSVHILLINSRGELMVCVRAATKKRYRLQITSSAGGHVELGESYRTAAVRELAEELCIQVKLKDLGRFDVVTKNERAIHHLFVGKLTRATTHPDKDEIQSFRFVEHAVLSRDVESHPRRYAKPFHEALKLYSSSTATSLSSRR